MACPHIPKTHHVAERGGRSQSTCPLASGRIRCDSGFLPVPHSPPLTGFSVFPWPLPQSVPKIPVQCSSVILPCAPIPHPFCLHPFYFPLSCEETKEGTLSTDQVQAKWKVPGSEPGIVPVLQELVIWGRVWASRQLAECYAGLGTSGGCREARYTGKDKQVDHRA